MDADILIKMSVGDKYIVSFMDIICAHVFGHERGPVQPSVEENSETFTAQSVGRGAYYSKSVPLVQCSLAGQLGSCRVMEVEHNYQTTQSCCPCWRKR